MHDATIKIIKALSLKLLLK